MKYFNWLLTNGVNRENGVLIKNFRFLTEKLSADFFGNKNFDFSDQIQNKIKC